MFVNSLLFLRVRRTSCKIANRVVGMLSSSIALSIISKRNTTKIRYATRSRPLCMHFTKMHFLEKKREEDKETRLFIEVLQSKHANESDPVKCGDILRNNEQPVLLDSHRATPFSYFPISCSVPRGEHD